MLEYPGEARAKRLPNIHHIRKELARRSLYKFVLYTWHLVETKPFVDGWHIRMICAHLEAVSRGKLMRLMINIPPRHMKSLLVSVFWPAWHWLWDPAHQWLFSSYAHSLSIRDAVRCRRLMQSAVYQSWLEQPGGGLAWVFTGDQNTKIRYENDQGGYRLATSVDGALTGEGGDTIVVDDAHNVVEGESATRRGACVTWWDESMSTRHNNPRVPRTVLMGQRVHHQDLYGHVLDSEEGALYDKVILPARYEPDAQRLVSSLGAVDPRTRADQCLWPERFGDAELTRLEARLTRYAVAAQLQQRPTPREGGLFPVGEMKYAERFNRAAVVATVRYWDKAGTEGGGKFTSGVRMHRLRDKTVVVDHVVRGQWAAGTREKIIKQWAILDNKEFGSPDDPAKVKTYVEQEPGSGGKESAENTVRNLAGFKVYADRPTGDKEARAEPFAAQVENGNVLVVAGANESWPAKYTEELQMFPNSDFTDQVDSSSGAFNKLFGLGTGVKRGGVF